MKEDEKVQDLSNSIRQQEVLSGLLHVLQAAAVENEAI
jgi:hypothetical protein